MSQPKSDRATEQLSRREFLRRASLGLAGIGFAVGGISSLRAALSETGQDTRIAQAPGQQAAANAGTSKVVRVHCEGVMENGQPNAAKVEQMTLKGMTELTGTNSLGEAFGQFVSPGEVVGLKVNPIAGPGMSTHIELVNAVIAGLLAAGIAENDIIVFDRNSNAIRNRGWTLNESGQGVRYMGTGGWDDDVYQDCTPAGKTVRCRYAKVLSQMVDKLINMPILKNHGTAGITISLKNLGFGVAEIPKPKTTGANAHDNNCSPYISQIVSNPVIQDKLVLNLVDCLKGEYNGGPGNKPEFQWMCENLLFSTDPIATDYVGLNIINEARTAAGMKAVSLDHAKHLVIAGQMGLGAKSANEVNEQAFELT